MNKQFIFIDDSGDPGFKRVSSANFVMAATLFMDSEVVTPFILIKIVFAKRRR